MKVRDSVGACCRLLGRLLALLGFVGVGVVDAVVAKVIICCGGNSALNGDSMRVEVSLLWVPNSDDNPSIGTRITILVVIVAS